MAYREVASVSFIGEDPENQHLKNMLFVGDLADYSEDRASYGDVIDPVHLYVMADGQTLHNVAWVHRTNLDWQTDGYTGGYSEMHHIACDCLPEAESHGQTEAIFTCNALVAALKNRAEEVRQTASIEDDYAKRRLILRLLRADREYPQSWPANVLQGEHQIFLLSMILQEHPVEVKCHVDQLVDEGKVDFQDDEIVRLAHQKAA